MPAPAAPVAPAPAPVPMSAEELLKENRDLKQQVSAWRAKAEIIGVVVEAGERCSSRTTCGSCTELADCGWCASEQKCVYGDKFAPHAEECPLYDFSQCRVVPCTARSSCDSCVQDPECGWCATQAQCLGGSAGGPFDRFQCGPLEWAHCGSKVTCASATLLPVPSLHTQSLWRRIQHQMVVSAARAEDPRWQVPEDEQPQDEAGNMSAIAERLTRLEKEHAALEKQLQQEKQAQLGCTPCQNRHATKASLKVVCCEGTTTTTPTPPTAPPPQTIVVTSTTIIYVPVYVPAPAVVVFAPAPAAAPMTTEAPKVKTIIRTITKTITKTIKEPCKVTTTPDIAASLGWRWVRAKVAKEAWGPYVDADAMKPDCSCGGCN